MSDGLTSRERLTIEYQMEWASIHYEYIRDLQKHLRIGRIIRWIFYALGPLNLLIFVQHMISGDNTGSAITSIVLTILAVVNIVLATRRIREVKREIAKAEEALNKPPEV